MNQGGGRKNYGSTTALYGVEVEVAVVRAEGLVGTAVVQEEAALVVGEAAIPGSAMNSRSLMARKMALMRIHLLQRTLIISGNKLLENQKISK